MLLVYTVTVCTIDCSRPHAAIHHPTTHNGWHRWHTIHRSCVSLPTHNPSFPPIQYPHIIPPNHHLHNNITLIMRFIPYTCDYTLNVKPRCVEPLVSFPITVCTALQRGDALPPSDHIVHWLCSMWTHTIIHTRYVFQLVISIRLACVSYCYSVGVWSRDHVTQPQCGHACHAL